MKTESLNKSLNTGRKKIGAKESFLPPVVGEKAKATVNFLKRGTDEAVLWIRRNPVQATLVGTITGVFMGIATKRAFGGKAGGKMS